ncbi:recombinase family protein [Neorhizobium galegae]|uniref:recombinase family protein n=1 Tax=Neorhizobium galegae TaxID=399 RepID=UPI00062201A1|nr:recombinase family protein [Neorhizobium galegae]CDZ54016.1 Cassette chromosome recombinase B [Neorhizobium galegae bv. orientalis]
MKRAVIYARYSTDLQNDRSVEDQIQLCKEHAIRIGAAIVEEYSDRAKSGASMFGRPGLAALMQAAERGDFNLLVSESPDRISRDIADLAHVHKTLKFRGVDINCVNGGAIDTVQVGMYGVIGQMQREESAKKTKRGMMGVVRSGRNAGGKCYGYMPVPGKAGELSIVEAEADVVRRIFELFASGISPRSIAAMLNEEGIAAPRSTRWNASTINGNSTRGCGIIRNPLYGGKRVWNRVRMVKDPSTGRRISRPNDPSEFEITEAPQLQIVATELFDAVQARKEAVFRQGKKGPRSKRLLSGLLRCGACGGGMSLVGPDKGGARIECSTHRESGTCDNRSRFYIDRIEEMVLDILRQQFADTSIIEMYVSAYQEEQKRVRGDAFRQRAQAQKALDDAKASITKIIEKMSKDLIDDDEATALLTPLRAERERQKAILDSVDEPVNVIELQPKAVQRFREDIETLSQIVRQNGVEISPELAVPFRQMVAAVVIEPRQPGEPYALTIKGYLSKLIGDEHSVIRLVAGGRIELPTSGL